MIKWIKPSGAEIETNDNPKNIEAAAALGWEHADGAPKDKPKGRGRPPKNKE